jgi:hypothetical protein
MNGDMQEVFCNEEGCDVSLGYQSTAAPIQWEMWVHNRCPVRLARNLGVDAELYGQMLAVATVALAGCYPDFPNNRLDDRSMDDFRHMRATIAAGAILECFGTVLKLKVERRPE